LSRKKEKKKKSYLKEAKREPKVKRGIESPTKKVIKTKKQKNIQIKKAKKKYSKLLKKTKRRLYAQKSNYKTTNPLYLLQPMLNVIKLFGTGKVGFLDSNISKPSLMFAGTIRRR
jgi:hypothetical protein